MRKDTVLVSIMGVNNEIGVLQVRYTVFNPSFKFMHIQDLHGIGQLCKDRKILFHTDAAQMIGKLPIDVNAMNISMMSISGHKIYGPKGVGAIYVRRRPRVRLEPLISGGGQERGLRSGTLPHFLAIGMGAACRVAAEEMENDHARIKRLSGRRVFLIQFLKKNSR